MKIVSLLIATFVIAMFSSGFFTFASFMFNANGNTPFAAESNVSESQKSIETMYNQSVTMQNSTNTGNTNVISFAPWNLLTGAYDMLKQSLNAPVFFITLIGDLGSKVTGLPPWVITDLVAIISAIAVWEIIYLIIGRK
jgi:hypothetical protein